MAKKIIFLGYDEKDKKWLTEFEPIATAVRLGEIEVITIDFNGNSHCRFLDDLGDQAALDILVTIVHPHTNDISILYLIERMWGEMGVPVIIFYPKKLDFSTWKEGNYHYGCVTGPELLSMTLRILRSYVDLIPPERMLLLVKRFKEVSQESMLDCFGMRDCAQKLAGGLFPASIVDNAKKIYPIMCHPNQCHIAVTVGNAIMDTSYSKNPGEACKTALLSTL